MTGGGTEAYPGGRSTGTEAYPGSQSTGTEEYTGGRRRDRGVSRRQEE